MSASVTARPASQENSCRLTPRSSDAVAVDQQQAVLDRHAPEPDRQHHALAGARDDALVEPRQLGAPRLHPIHDRGLAARDVDAQRRNHHMHVHRRVHAQDPRAGHVVVVRVHEHVVDRARRPRQQRHVAEDPRQPPHVLVLEVGAGRPLVHAHREHVLLARPQRPADVELRRQPAPPRGPDVRAVHPRAHARVDALEPQHHSVRPRRRHVEPAAVVAGRVLVRDVRRIDRERIADVRVRGCSVAVQLPVRRHRDPVPTRVVEAALDEVGRHVRPRPTAGTPTSRSVTAGARRRSATPAPGACPSPGPGCS